ncbi:hypothetical protein K493DRAFT_7229 [Basidiobolus meristosporus CBS 931.73]|uniref:Uncharacterized protein n=1 Tax=Basidiobolus meristosporus CBS 931.73 TaxID=1314790 RepID=A0A1Y1YK89_9FUNG|nr:hypothetical protein K493DRAFT_7229 [Basidiobolus meristosporus CBS 931.73]|eukprot:ORX98409.1 hypothetical protein K493DRAFT_7229 [Basidiobolus meristosporus CBS 931.73]
MLANAKFPRLSFGRAKFFTSQPQFLQELGDVGLFLETEDDPSELKECVRRLLLKLSSQDTEIGALKSSLDEKSQAEQRATEKLQSLEADNQQYKDTLQVTQGQLRELEDQFAEWQSKLATQHQHEIDNLCKRLEAEANKSESEILQLARDNEALRKKNHQLNEKIQEFEETVAYVTKQCDLAEQDRHSFNTTVKEMVGMLYQPIVHLVVKQPCLGLGGEVRSRIQKVSPGDSPRDETPD